MNVSGVNIDSLVSSIRKLTYKNVIAVTMLCIVGLSTYAGYKYIQQFSFEIGLKQESDKDKYLREFGLTDLEISQRIKDILTEARVMSGATQVALWGYHNGVNNGPFPFRKTSILDESISQGSARLARKYQSLPLNLFLDLTIDLWKKQGDYLDFFRNDIKDKYPYTYYEMVENNTYYQFNIAIILEGYDSPIGVLVIYYDKADYDAAFPNKITKDKIIFNLYEKGGQINLLFNKLASRHDVTR